MSSKQKGGGGVENQQTLKPVKVPETSKEKINRALKTLGLWFVFAFVAALIAALVPSVRSCIQVGLNPCMVAIFTSPQAAAPSSANRENQPGQPVGQDRPSWAKANFMDWVILLVSLIVAVRIMYPPKDLDDSFGGTAPGSDLPKNATGPHQI